MLVKNETCTSRSGKSFWEFDGEKSSGMLSEYTSRKLYQLSDEFVCVCAMSYERQQEYYLKLENLFGTVQPKARIIQ